MSSGFVFTFFIQTLQEKKNQGCLPGFIVLVILRSFYIEKKKNLSKQVQQLPCISPSDH